MPRWIHRLFHNDVVNEQLDAELQFHLEQQIADNIAAGMTAEEGRRRAQIEIGGVEQVKQKTRDVHWENWIENVSRDLRFAVRSLGKDWRVAVTAVFMLALGIGASTVVFSIFYNLLFNAFDTRDASRLVIPMREGFRNGEIPQPLNCSLADMSAIREQNHVFEDVAGFGAHGGFDLIRDGTRSHQLNGVRVTGNAFTFYGVSALLGRGILPEDEKPGAESAFVISYDAWKNEFNSDPLVIGKTFIVSEEPRTLVGVMPPRFHAYNAHADLWMPFNNPYLGRYSLAGGIMLARLKPGVTLAAASAELRLIIGRLEKAASVESFQRFRKTFQWADGNSHRLSAGAARAGHLRSPPRQPRWLRSKAHDLQPAGRRLVAAFDGLHQCSKLAACPCYRPRKGDCRSRCAGRFSRKVDSATSAGKFCVGICGMCCRLHFRVLWRERR